MNKIVMTMDEYKGLLNPSEEDKEKLRKLREERNKHIKITEVNENGFVAEVDNIYV